MTREGEGNTENQDFKLRNRGTQRFMTSWEQADGCPLGRPQYFLVCQNSLSPNFGHNLHLVELF